MCVSRRARAVEVAVSLAGIVAAIVGCSAALAACGGPGDGPGAPDAAGPQDAAAPDPASGAAPPAAPARAALRVAFRLDPRLTDGLYMGERWVSPSTFEAAAQTGRTFTVEARIEVAAGTPPGPAAWTPSDPGAVAVAPAGGRTVEIAVLRPGRSAIAVTAGGDATTVTVDAVHDGGSWRVTFQQ